MLNEVDLANKDKQKVQTNGRITVSRTTFRPECNSHPNQTTLIKIFVAFLARMVQNPRLFALHIPIQLN